MDDRTCLEVLELNIVQGLSSDKIAKKLELTKGQVSGFLWRVRNETGPNDKFDGTMPSRWWEGGLSKRDGSDKSESCDPH